MKCQHSLLIVAIVALICSGSPVAAQGGLPPDESDTAARIDGWFRLQDTYSRVLCVSQDGSCPQTITAAPPCLIAACTRPPAEVSVAQTFDTIQAAADAAQPGDLIAITPGRYRGVQFEERGGADGAYIHFLGLGEPGSVIVDSPADPDVAYLRHHFYFIAAHHIIVQNIAFEGADDGAGLFFSGYFEGTGQFSHHIIVTDVYSHDNGEWGLHTTSTSYVLVQDSFFTGSGEEHGAYFSGSGDHMVIRRNVFQGNAAAGLQVNPDPQTATMNVFYWLVESTGNTCGYSEADVDFTGPATWHDINACYDSQSLPDLGEFFEDGISADLIIEQNVITGNGAAGGAGINLAALRDSTVRNNLIYSNAAAGIACWDNAYAEEKGLESSEFGCQNVQIANNTIVDVTGTRGALILNQDARSLQVVNNIIVRGDRDDAYEITGRSGAGLVSGANYYSAQLVENSPGAVLLDSDPASGSITGFSVAEALAHFAAPGFAPWILEDGPWPTLNPARPDFHLRPGSPLLTLGRAASTLDLKGAPRTGSEIGALVAGGPAFAQAAAEPASPPASGGGSVAAGGTIIYRLPEGPIYRVEARAGAVPQDLSAALDALAPGTGDEWANVSPGGEWLLISTERFDPECAGWPCLVLLNADLSAWEVVRANGAPVHSGGFAAVGRVPGVIAYPVVVIAAGGGPHAQDLWVITRGESGWSTPALLSAASPYAYNHQPALAADGSRVVFDCGSVPYGQEGTAICEVGADGTGFRVVITPADGPGGSDMHALHHPDYAPDGSIVFEATWQGEQLWRLLPGAAEPVLVNPAFTNDNSPCVLPGGEIVSLWLNRPDGPSTHEIKVMSPDGARFFMAATGIDVLDGGIGCGR